MTHNFRYIYLVILLVLGASHVQAQNIKIKTLQAVRVQKAPKIDGVADDPQWQNAKEATGFYMYKPGDGDPMPKEFDTKVKVVYDDAGLYILALLNDPNPDKITRIFGLRDQTIQADQFSVIINPFSTPNNNYLFAVYASGSQLDGNDPKAKDLS